LLSKPFREEALIDFLEFAVGRPEAAAVDG
jgi:hypothetical protein